MRTSLLMLMIACAPPQTSRVCLGNGFCFDDDGGVFYEDGRPYCPSCGDTYTPGDGDRGGFDPGDSVFVDPLAGCTCDRSLDDNDGDCIPNAREIGGLLADDP